MTAELRRISGPFAANWALKLSALGLAFLLWTVVKADNRMVLEDIPVRVVNRDADWVLAADAEPPSVGVVFTGPVRELLRVAVEKPSVIIPVDVVSDSTEIHILRTNFVSPFDGMTSTRVEEFRPNTVRLRFDRVETRFVPLAVRLTGRPAEGFELAGRATIDPPTVRVTGGATRLAALDSIRLPSIDIGTRTTTDTQVVAIDTAGFGMSVSPRQAQVVVPIRRALADTIFSPTAPQTAAPLRRGGGDP